MINGDINIKDIDLDLLDSDIIENSLKETQKLYLNAFVNIELYNYLIWYMEQEKKEEKSKEWKLWLDTAIENQRQQKLATIKMIDNHAKNIKTLKTLLTK